ncbi:MAG: selenocysteine-specific translation elongation factor [Chloroflexi bacterium]|nr:selenocysteine-specific translation elongation factor [Chloroflexota bacterium]
MYTIGTAGHVDHGKSTLINALTGIDPDRLQEEKERGMTIDLGFAWLRLPGGSEISIVDVPGHERFIKNMLAGVGGIDLALLVVAADEGVMPQTEEHLAILDLLRVKRGLVALTKKDLVDEEWLELVTADVQECLRGTVLENAPLVPVSSTSGEGLPELQAMLERLLADTPQKKDVGRPRLPIDRVFTLAGFGTIVTGTLIDGKLQTGQEVEILPAGLKSRVRGLQTHKHKVETAPPGSRVAINLASVATSDLRRGDVVATPRWLIPTQRIDVSLRILGGAARPLKHGARVSLHVGASEVMATVSLLDVEQIEPGESGWAQVRLGEPVAAVKGDFFVIRTPNATIGGGEVVDAHARRHRRFQTAVVESLEVFQRGSPEDIVLQALEGRRPCEVDTLTQVSGLPQDVVKSSLSQLVDSSRVVRFNDHYATIQAWEKLEQEILGILRAYHQQHPLRAGMPREEAKSKLALSARPFAEITQRLVERGSAVEHGSSLRLREHSVRFSDEQQERIQAMMRLLDDSPFSPPSLPELEQRFGIDDEVINALLEQKKLVKIADGLVFLPDAYEQMVQKVLAHMKARGKVTVAEVRDILGSSRKYVLALMEHLDDQKVTRRVGDERVLRS